MVNYDSKTKTLIFKKMFINDGQPTWTQGVTVSLTEFDEATRQFIIALAKQAINFANGHEIVLAHLKRSKEVKTTDEKPESDKENQSEVAKLSGETPKDDSTNVEITAGKTE